MVSLLVWTPAGRLAVLPAFELQLLQPIEHQLLVQCLEGEGALGGVDVETAAAVGLQQGPEGGAAEPDPAQRGLVLWPAVVQQLVPLLLVAEPAQLPGL